MTMNTTTTTPAAPAPDLTLKQAAAALGTSRATLYRLIADGAVRTYRLRGQQRVTQVELARIRCGESQTTPEYLA